jgi:UDP-glucose 4-epimerase
LGEVLVAGGAGFIGSHCLKALRARGVSHFALDNLSKGHKKAVGNSELVEADLNDPASLDRALAERDISVVIHFAASIEVGESVAEPGGYWQNNVVGTLNLLEAMRRRGIEAFVFSSTAAVFGEPERVPIDEDHPKNPTSPYGDTKLAVEKLLAAYGRAHGLRSVVLRYFNACGADPEGELGEDHHPETHLIPRTLLAAHGRAPGLTLFGTDYPTPDGTCIRDYIHVCDLIDAHLLAVDHLLQGGESVSRNLGSGIGFSVREVIRAVEKVTGKQVPVTEAPRRPGDPARLIADSTAIRSQWGWEPKWTQLEDVVRHSSAWMEKNPGGYEN